MSIATRIEAIEQHLTEDYNVLELAGADLTNVDKNIVNLKPTWKERLLYFINNGTDEVWENWDKVTGEGTSLTLNNTLEAKMKIELKGNTYQYSTSGKNLLNCELETIKGMNTFFTWNGNVGTYAGITITINNDNTIKINGTNNQSSNIVISIASITNIADIVALSTPVKVSVGDISGSRTTYYVRVLNYSETTSKDLYDSTDETITIENSTTRVYIVILPSTTINNVLFKPMIRLASITDNTYEPYTNGASPNPDYPQDIHVVSGDNSIKVEGKNLLSINLSDYIIGTYARKFISDNNYVMYLQDNDTSVSVSGCYIGLSTTGDVGGSVQWCLNNGTLQNQVRTNYDGTLKYICFYPANQETLNKILSRYKVMVATGTYTSETLPPYQPYQSQTYPINLPEGMELCKIGTYEDRIFKSSGKNSVEGEIVNGSINDSGYIGSSSAFKMWYAKITQGETYTVSTDERNLVAGFFYTQPLLYSTSYNNSRLAQANKTFTAPITGYVAFRTNANYSTPMINKGSTSLPYEPYETGWYLKKEIGKVVLNGSESDWVSWGQNNTGYKLNNVPNANGTMDNIVYPIFSNYFKAETQGNIYRGTTGIQAFGGTFNAIYIRDNNTTSLADFKTWLSTHNTIVYYPLTTPTYTKITDSTLISQLNALENARSYLDQTNLSQVNDDLSFILDLTALEKLS